MHCASALHDFYCAVMRVSTSLMFGGVWLGSAKAAEKHRNMAVRDEDVAFLMLLRDLHGKNLISLTMSLDEVLYNYYTLCQ